MRYRYDIAITKVTMIIRHRSSQNQRIGIIIDRCHLDACFFSKPEHPRQHRQSNLKLAFRLPASEILHQRTLAPTATVWQKCFAWETKVFWDVSSSLPPSTDNKGPYVHLHTAGAVVSDSGHVFHMIGMPDLQPPATPTLATTPPDLRRLAGTTLWPGSPCQGETMQNHRSNVKNHQTFRNSTFKP